MAADREIWTQTSLGWFREEPGPPGTEAYPPRGMELGLMERVARLAGREVIEIGCGDGRLTFQYAPRARRVTALDPNEAEIARAREHAKAVGVGNVRFLARAAHHGNIPGGPYDVALFTWSL